MSESLRPVLIPGGGWMITHYWPAEDIAVSHPVIGWGATVGTHEENLNYAIAPYEVTTGDALVSEIGDQFDKDRWILWHPDSAGDNPIADHAAALAYLKAQVPLAAAKDGQQS